MSHIMYKYIIFCVFWVTLSACTTTNKAVKFFDKKKDIAAKYCADRFPVRETIDTVEIFDSLAWKSYEDEYMYMAMYIDSLLSIKCDTQTRQDIMYLVGRIPSAPCPDRVVIKTVENTAKSKVILDSCSKKTDSLVNVIKHKEKQIDQALSVINKQASDVQKYKRERNRNLWWVLILLAVTLRKPLYRGARRLITKI